MDKSEIILSVTRNFVVDQDEELWPRIMDCYADDPDYASLTIEQFRAEEELPHFDSKGMFIAEVGSTPMGCANGIIDRQRTDGKAWFSDLAVLPAFRRKGIGRILCICVLDWLKENGQVLVETSVSEERVPARNRVKSLGFKEVRSSSRMELDLSKPMILKPGNTGITIQKSDKGNSDIELLMHMRNETFSKHYNYRPLTQDEIITQYINNPEYSMTELYFAQFEGDTIGFIVLTFDADYNRLTKTNTGWIQVIGVLKPYRKKGIGTELLMHGLKRLKEFGMTRAVLYVDDFNVTKALDLYIKVGFFVKKRYITYQRSL